MPHRGSSSPNPHPFSPVLLVAKKVGDRLGECMAYGNLGNVYQALGNYAKAIEYHTQELL